eukprot:jgi/Bigna1/136508/aug1.34_g11216
MKPRNRNLFCRWQSSLDVPSTFSVSFIRVKGSLWSQGASSTIQPYCTLTIAKSATDHPQVRTEAKSGPHPVWNEEHIFAVIRLSYLTSKAIDSILIIKFLTLIHYDLVDCDGKVDNFKGELEILILDRETSSKIYGFVDVPIGTYEIGRVNTIDQELWMSRRHKMRLPGLLRFQFELCVREIVESGGSRGLGGGANLLYSSSGIKGQDNSDVQLHAIASLGSSVSS